MRIVLLTLVMMFIVTACGPPPELRDETLLHDTSLVTGDPCAAPCFMGITPGETDWNDALTILEDAADFLDVNVQTAEDDSQRVQVSWKEGEEGNTCCQLLSEDGETVRLTFLRTAPEMTLSQVIDVHGDPTYLASQEFTAEQAIMSLVYPEIPMVVYAFVEGAESGQLRSTSEIIGVLYFVEEDMDLLLKTTDLHAWEGYQSYAAYNEGEFEVTASVTLTPTPDG